MKNKKIVSLIALILVLIFTLSTFTVYATPLFSDNTALLAEDDEYSDVEEEDYYQDDYSTETEEDTYSGIEEDNYSSDNEENEENITDTDEAVVSPDPDTVPEEEPAFTKTGTYGEIQPYNDVYVDHWFYSSVANAYEYGLMFGKSKTVFGPNDTMTVAEAITIACRLNTIYYGREAVTTSSTGMWYDNYVTYAVNNGIIAEGDFADYNTPITRAEMARIFAKTLPAEWLNKINTIDAIPDMDVSNADYNAVLTLYQAGICSGSDAQHNYQPETNIKRSEVAAIITRLAYKDLRVTF